MRNCEPIHWHEAGVIKGSFVFSGCNRRQKKYCDRPGKASVIVAGQYNFAIVALNRDLRNLQGLL
jgi:hypothetical protein